MSLINQVLQDLDRRQASGAVMPAAVKALPAAAHRASRWRLAAIMGALVLVIGGAAAAVAWSAALRSVQPVAATRAVPVAAAPTPVVVVTAASTPPVAARSATTPVVVVSKARTAPAVATPAPVAEAASVPSTLVAVAPTSLIKPPASIAPSGEARIEKRAPSRTAHERAEADYQRGVALHQAGQFADAAAAYAGALREEPTLAAARLALAGALINQGKDDDARAVLAEGLVLAPQHTGLAMMLARVHAERGDMQRAAEVLQPTDTASMSAEDHAFRAAILQRVNHHAEASDHFAAALRTMPNNGVWWMGLGISQAAEGRADHAREAFNRARSSGSLTPELAQYVELRLKQL